nr:CoB--CoM heterodisulfide reductase iron-sulfur subunit A family protein [Candidatus Sigynarchaeum springense]
MPEPEKTEKAASTRPETKPKIGVFVCECGGNISGKVRVQDVATFAKTLPDVEVAEYNFSMCSSVGVDLIKKAIEEKGIDRTVVCSCSKAQHGPTFARAIEEAGLNKHMHEQVNIREWDSWVTKGKNEATEKAKKSLEAGVNRSRKLEPVETRQIPVTKAALVIGGGIAGCRAAMDMANLGVPVHLVEQLPTIGGHMTQLFKTFPTNECPQCSISPLTNGVANNKNITLYTNANIKNVEGSIGKFIVDIEIKPRYVESNCTSCGKCSENCPVEVPSEWDSGMTYRKAIYKPFPQAIPATYIRDKNACIECNTCINVCPVDAVNFKQKKQEVRLEVGTIVVAIGYDEYDPAEIEAYHYGDPGFENVITQLKLERMMTPVSITGGEILRPSDGNVPKKIVMIQCVGSRNDQVGNKYCTGVCCMFALKNAQIIKDKHPEMDITICYIDIRTPGLQYEEFYKRAQQLGVRFIRGRPSEIARDPATGQLHVITEDTLSMTPVKLAADMVVLSAAMVPPKTIGTLGSKLHVLRSAEGFIKEYHIKMNPTSSSKGGIFIAGAIQGPKDITQSVAQAGSAAALAAAPLVKGYIEKDMLVPVIDEALCVHCNSCVAVCPVSAISKSEDGKFVVNDVACKSCGLCMPACPTAAIQLKNFRDDQIHDEIVALTEKPREGGHVHG